MKPANPARQKSTSPAPHSDQDPARGVPDPRSRPDQRGRMAAADGSERVLSAAALFPWLPDVEPRRVRPYEDRVVEVRGAKRPVQTRQYHPMSHLEIIGNLLCCFDEFSGLEPDGSREAGYSRHECRDCDEIADDRQKNRRLAFDDFVDSLHDHEKEEQLR